MRDARVSRFPRTGAGVLIALLAAGCADQHATPMPSAPATALSTAASPFPHVRVNIAERWAEFDAEVTPMMVFTERTPLLYLEVLACSPDSRAHETLVISTARPSHVHAALLLIGLNPGTPGAIRFEGKTPVARQPAGDRVRVRFFYDAPDGTPRECDPADWIENARDGRGLADSERASATRLALPSGPGFVFAGSYIDKRAGREVYKADEEGTLIGLTTFGNEPIAWFRTISPEASVQTPEWVVRRSAVPAPGTPVRVRLSPETDPSGLSGGQPLRGGASNRLL